jgi:nitrogenase molybdenum-iron protein alpha/beta subunit
MDRIHREVSNVLGVLVGSDQEDESRRQERNERSEQKFKLSLKRLYGQTIAVTIDDMCDVMCYIQDNGVHDLSFVEEAYKLSIFSDDEFLEKTNIIVCSVEQFIAAWEDAKEKKDAEILKLFRDKHRHARKFLEEPEIKDQIREFDRILDQRNLYKDYCDLLLMSVRFVRRHLRNPTTSYLMEQVIPNMTGLANRMNFPFLSSSPSH